MRKTHRLRFVLDKFYHGRNEKYKIANIDLIWRILVLPVTSFFYINLQCRSTDGLCRHSYNSTFPVRWKKNVPLSLRNRISNFCKLTGGILRNKMYEQSKQPLLIFDEKLEKIHGWLFHIMVRNILKLLQFHTRINGIQQCLQFTMQCSQEKLFLYNLILNVDCKIETNIY